MDRKVRLGATMLLALPLFFGLLTASVRAAPPKVESITWYSQGTSKVLEITIRYLGTFKDGDNLDQVEVKIDGKVYAISLPPIRGSYQPEIWVESLDVGEVTGTPSVQARAHSTADGWGDWSSPVTIPEFPTATIVLFLTALMMLALTSKLSMRKIP